MTMRAVLNFGAYIMSPPWARVAHRLLLIGGYIIMIVAGFAATTLGFPANVAGCVVIAGGLLAIFGVISRYYQAEAVAIWPQITGLLTCVIWLQIPPQSAVLSGWLVSAYCFFLGVRLLELNVVAYRARREAEGG